MTYTIGNVLDVLPTIDAGRFQCCVTSPPYWGLRDYGHAEQLGLEATPREYVDNMVAVFREVRRVLRDDGTLWLNIGDSYAGSGRGGYPGGRTGLEGSVEGQDGARAAKCEMKHRRSVDGGAIGRRWSPVPHTLKRKDLCGIPWRLAFALQDDGWYLRSDIIWHKPNPMPESVTDRPTKAHEYVFLLAKSEGYFYDADAIAEPSRWSGQNRSSRDPEPSAVPGAPAHKGLLDDVKPTANARTVWTIASKPYNGAHFATMPPELAQRCILAGSRIGDEVLDPFLGSGTTGMVAEQLWRKWFGIELQPSYEPLIRGRTAQRGLFS